MSQEKFSKTVSLLNVRLSFVHVEHPFSFNQGDDPIYSCTVLIPKGSVAEKQYFAAVNEVLNHPMNAKILGAWTSAHNWPAKDGDTTEALENKGHWLVNVKNKQDQNGVLTQPALAVRDGSTVRLPFAGEIYSGCYVAIEVALFPFSNKAKGIGAKYRSWRGIHAQRRGQASSGPEVFVVW